MAIITGNDGSNTLSGTAGRDLIYGFDPNGPQGEVTAITATRVASGLTSALFVTAPPGDTDHLFIVQQNGTIRVLDVNTGVLAPTPYLTVAVDSSGERGLLGLTFDPDYATNGFFYIYRTVAGSPAHNEVDRYHVSADPNVADSASATPIISLDNLSGATNHNAGWIGFGPDGDLYIAAGENANGANAQTMSNLLGKILRIDVHADAFPADPNANYAIPGDNPFVATAGARGEIFALGLRNPFRDSFDRGTGDFFIADVGQNSFEEIDRGASGANYGWPNAEGPTGNGPGITAPLFSYDHTVGQAIIGGYVYRGTSEGLQGQYFFADEVAGKVFTMRFDGNTWVPTERTAQITTDTGAINNPTSFGEDGRGNLYISDFDGDIFRLTPLVASADQGDILSGNGGDDMLFAGSGLDVLNGGPGADVLNGGAGSDTAVYATSSVGVTVNLATGHGSGGDAEGDILSDIENLIGSAFADNLTGDANANVFFGGGGDDALDGAGGSDTAVFSRARSAYTITDLGGGIQQVAGPDGTDTLTSIEHLVFAQIFPVDAGMHGDLGGDGRADVLLRNDSGGGVALWQMNGGQVQNATVIGSVGAEWHVQGNADFNGDGRADILWRADDGSVMTWHMAGAQIQSAQVIGQVGNEWRIDGTGDFDGDGRGDMLWRDTAGDLMIWEMNGAQIRTAEVIGRIGNEWHDVGLGDFNGDGKSDILWRNDAGELLEFQMNGTQIASAPSVGQVGPEWHVRGLGDFNADAKQDVLWQNDSGLLMIWQMDGANIASSQTLNGLPADWHAFGTGDFGGDGKSDILWRNDDGTVAEWQMDGAQITGAQVISPLGTDWSLGVHHYDLV